MIISVYCIGRGIPLYGIDPAMYESKIEAGMLLEQSVGGDIYKCSLLTLGISPYMISSILMRVINATRPSDVKGRTSARKKNRFALTLMLFLAVAMAVSRLDELQFVSDGTLWGMRTVATLEMVTGAFIILWLAERNKRYGIGGQTALIFVNILDGIIAITRTIDM